MELRRLFCSAVVGIHAILPTSGLARKAFPFVVCFGLLYLLLLYITALSFPLFTPSAVVGGP